MADGYRIIGAEMSPYSVKVHSYFRYKDIPHQWIVRNAASQAEFEKYAKMPIIPLVVTPDGAGIQDSTPIIDQVEKLHPEPSIHPAEPVTQFISALNIMPDRSACCAPNTLPLPTSAIST
jgi:glutathione S-transferase